MFRKDLLIPALIGLGVFSRNSEVSLCNDTTMLLLLYAVLSEREEDHHREDFYRFRGRPFRAFDDRPICPNCKNCFF